MFSPELEKFLKAYQIKPEEVNGPETKCIHFKKGGGILASVEILVKK